MKQALLITNFIVFSFSFPLPLFSGTVRNELAVIRYLGTAGQQYPGEERGGVGLGRVREAPGGKGLTGG